MSETGPIIQQREADRSAMWISVTRFVSVTRALRTDVLLLDQSINCNAPTAQLCRVKVRYRLHSLTIIVISIAVHTIRSVTVASHLPPASTLVRNLLGYEHVCWTSFGTLGRLAFSQFRFSFCRVREFSSCSPLGCRKHARMMLR